MKRFLLLYFLFPFRELFSTSVCHIFMYSSLHSTRHPTFVIIKEMLMRDDIGNRFLLLLKMTFQGKINFTK